jgi:hypothetical protein
MNQRRIYTYESELRGTRKVCCTYREYLFLKLCYSVDGLTEDEYETYKRLSNDENNK